MFGTETFCPEKNEAAGGLGKLHHEGLHTSPTIITVINSEVQLGGTFSA
jgi:hypothetical protein